MHFYGLEEVCLEVIQAENAEDLALSTTLSSAEQANAVLSKQVSELQRQLAAVAAYDTLSLSITDEARPNFPDIHTIAVGKLSGTLTAVVSPQEGKRLDKETIERLEEWLRIRTKAQDLDIVVRYTIESVEK